MKKRILAWISAALVAVTSLLMVSADTASAAEEVPVKIFNRYQKESTGTSEEPPIIISGAEISAFKIGKMNVSDGAIATLVDIEPEFQGISNNITTASDRLQVIEEAKKIIKDNNLTVPDGDCKGITPEQVGDGEETPLVLYLDPDYVYLFLQTGFEEGSVAKDYLLLPILATLPDETYKQDIYAKYELDEIPETGLTQVGVEKVWDDNDNEALIRPTSITAVLYANGEEIDRQVLNAANGWTHIFQGTDGLGLPEKDAAGTDIKYTVDEIITNELKPYVKSIVEGTKEAEGYGSYKHVTITNTYKPDLPETTPTPPPGETPPPTVTVKKNPPTSTTGTATRVKTGDTNNIILWIAIAAAALLVIIIAVVAKKRRSDKE